jgi:hypothetical protein
MPTQIQWRRGNTAQTAAFTGALAEVTVDTDKKTLVVHDGVTQGGFTLALESAQQDALAFNKANGAYDKANSANIIAQNAFNQVNVAFDVANTKYSASGGTIAGNVLVSGNVTPTTDNDKYLGSSLYRWHTVFVGPGSVDIDGIKIQNTAGKLVISGATDFVVPGAPGTAAISATANAAYATANTALLSTGAFAQANAAYDKANSAYDLANNVAPQVQPAFDKANAGFGIATSGFAQANLAYDKANSATILAQGAYDTANNVAPQVQPAYDKANNAYNQANTATILAQGAYDSANNVAPQVQPAYNRANNAFAQANLAFDTANSGLGIATSGFAQANLAYTTANSANILAQAAFDAANTKFSSSGGTVSGNMTVTGNLTIGGSTTTLSAINLSVADNMLYLNDGVLTTITNAVGNGTSVIYTTSATHNYQVGMFVTVTGMNPTAYNTTNTIITAVTTNTFNIASSGTGSFVSGGTARAKSSANPDLGFAGGYNDGTYRHAGLFRDATDGIWKFYHNYQPEPDASPFIDTSNTSFRIANLTANIITDVVTLRGLDPLAYANTIQTSAQANVGAGLITVTSAYQANVGAGLLAYQTTSQANVGAGLITVTGRVNSAFGQANLAFTQANTGTGVATSAFGQANLAFTQANTGTGVATSAFGQANLAYAIANSAAFSANTKVSKSGDTIAGTLTAEAFVSNTSFSVGGTSYVAVSSNTFTTASTSQVAIDSFDKTIYRSAKYFVQLTSGTSYHVIELNVLHDGTTTYIAQYGEMFSGSSLGTFDAYISGGFVNLYLTAANSVTVAKLARTAIVI